ncbi:response regulator [Shimia sp. R10_1]|uniref:response regulator n=1 Tax=Shimia sp. R10_1 TaxID=2821095 RepID=UPI001ADADF82|nr:response regulator [Shimia sp. R10_1]MBO9472191.1 response regulator [Shimia sp. R10_1]
MTKTELAALNPRILVADDEPTNLKIMQRMLKHCGLQCEVAHDGAESIEKAKTGVFDLILMDINMPEIDGIEATQEIMKLLGSDAPKVIAVTASVSNTQKKLCEDAGIVGFVAKPVKLDTLVDAMAECLC